MAYGECIVAARGKYLRETVLEILQDRSEPMSAYDVLHELQKVTGKVAPPTVYRTLSSLQNQRAIHRLESLNAYVVCNQDCMQSSNNFDLRYMWRSRGKRV